MTPALARLGMSAMRPSSPAGWGAQAMQAVARPALPVASAAIVPQALGSSAATVPYGASPAGKHFTTLRIVYNNDPHEKIQSLPKVVTAFDYFSREGEAQGRDVLRLNGGDNNIGVEPLEWGLNVMLMNMIRYHATTVGNHELDIGSRNFANGLKLANFPVVISNLDIDGRSGIAEKLKEQRIHNGPLVVRGRQGTYGIIGVTTPKLHDVLSPKADLEGCDVEDMEDTIELVREQVRALEAQGVNKIIMLSHMDVEHDKQVISQVPGIDFVVSAHDHRSFKGIEPGKNLFLSPRGEPVMLVEAGKNNNWLGVADLVFDENGTLYPQSNTLVNPFRFQPNPMAEAFKNAVLGQPKTLAVVTTPYESGNNAFSPDPVAQFTADTMRQISGADIAFVRSPEIRSDIQPGELTDQLTHELMPFTDPVVRITATGEEIWKSLGLSARCLKDNETHPGMLHPSGLFVQMNKQTGQVEAIYLHNRQTGQWQPLPPDQKTYTVALGEFSVLNKGEYKDLAYPERITWRSGKPVREFFEMGLQMAGAPARPIAFKDDGRLRIV